MLHEVLLPGAAGPAVVVPAPDKVDHRSQARAADAQQAHGQVVIPPVISNNTSGPKSPQKVPNKNVKAGAGTIITRAHTGPTHPTPPLLYFRLRLIRYLFKM